MSIARIAAYGGFLAVFAVVIAAYNGAYLLVQNVISRRGPPFPTNAELQTSFEFRIQRHWRRLLCRAALGTGNTTAILPPGFASSATAPEWHFRTVLLNWSTEMSWMQPENRQAIAGMVPILPQCCCFRGGNAPRGASGGRRGVLREAHSPNPGRTLFRVPFRQNESA